MKYFHTLFGKELSARVKEYAVKQKCSFSCLVNMLIGIGLSRFEMNYWRRGDLKSKWKKIGGSPGRHIVIIEERFYRRLKKIHIDCNVYSMSQVLRRVVSVVLFIVERHGMGYAVGFFRKGYAKYKKKRYNIDSDNCSEHMHKKIAIQTEFSAESIPLAIEFT